MDEPDIETPRTTKVPYLILYLIPYDCPKWANILTGVPLYLLKVHNN